MTVEGKGEDVISEIHSKIHHALVRLIARAELSLIAEGAVWIFFVNGDKCGFEFNHTQVLCFR